MVCGTIEQCLLHREPLGYFRINPETKTLDRKWRCVKCGRVLREVYEFSKMVDDNTGEKLV